MMVAGDLSLYNKTYKRAKYNIYDVKLVSVKSIQNMWAFFLPVLGPLCPSNKSYCIPITHEIILANLRPLLLRKIS